jgi:hypothetical protein
MPLDTPRTCFRCSYETDQPLEHCPQCGYRLHTARQVRRRGGVLVGLGLLLVVSMVVLAVLMIRVMTGQTADRFTGSTRDAAFILGVLYLVAMLGGVAVVEGVWQFRYGRRNRTLSLLLLGLGFLFFLLGLLVKALG